MVAWRPLNVTLHVHCLSCWSYRWRHSDASKHSNYVPSDTAWLPITPESSVYLILNYYRIGQKHYIVCTLCYLKIFNFHAINDSPWSWSTGFSAVNRSLTQNIGYETLLPPNFSSRESCCSSSDLCPYFGGFLVQVSSCLSLNFLKLSIFRRLPLSPGITFYTSELDKYKLNVLPTECIYVFCKELIGFYNPDGMFLLGDTSWEYIIQFISPWRV